MEPTTLRILGIAPYEGMRALMAKEAELYPQLQVDLFTGDLDDGVAIVKRMQGEYYDAVISRGGTAEMIRQATQLPVLPIQISVYDILRAIKMAESYTSRYAIVGFASITKPAHTLCDLLQITVDIVTVAKQNEVDQVLHRLRSSGCQAVVCDMATHTCARELGMDAFLISSGAESIHNAFQQAIAVCTGMSFFRRENLYLRALAEETESDVIVLRDSGALEYSTRSNPPSDLVEELRKAVPGATRRPSQFFINHGTDLYQVTARRSFGLPEESTMFFYSAYQIPTRTKNSGISSISPEECRHLFQRSIFSISGTLGEIEPRLKQMASTPKPVMILGEYGTGKEQIARAIYLYRGGKGAPLITVDCALVNEKGWEFLFEHENSPIHGRSATIYMKRLESIPENRLAQLLSILLETNLTRRLRLIFSCDRAETKPMPWCAQAILERVSCLLLTMPALRSRSDEIPSLTSLYLAALNLELGKQLIGPDPQATRLLQRYDWPGNYVQFQNLLYELAVITDGAYIRSDDVTQLLSREHGLRFSTRTAGAGEQSARTLEQITLNAVEDALAAANGNQSQAAKQLGISRSTLWRYLKQIEKAQSI